ncbi:hypothetical protein NQZ79_g7156 [Umbelopsis isabellina]|nr:hypothetical protein NQZ79_g7156 [Umbelopsis isabellina]
MGSKSFDLCDQRESKHGYTGQSKETQQELAPCAELHTPNISLAQRLSSSLKRWLCPGATIIEVSWDDGKSWLPLDKDNSKQIERVRAKQTISCVDVRNDRHLCKHLTHEGVDVMIKVWLKEENVPSTQDATQWSVRRVKNWKKTYLGCAEVPPSEVPAGTKWIYLPGPPQYETPSSPVPSFRADSATSIDIPSDNKFATIPMDKQSIKTLGSKPSMDFTFQCPLPARYQFPVIPSKGLNKKSFDNLRHKYSTSSLSSVDSDFDTEIESCGWRLTQMQCLPAFDNIKPLRYTAIEHYGAVEGVLAC